MIIQDVFAEQMIKKPLTWKDILLFLGYTLVGGAIIFYVNYSFGPVASFFLIAGLFVGLYYIYSWKNLEFEYSITNGEVTIDKIMDKKSRKRLTSFDCSNVEEYGVYAKEAQRLKNRTFDTKIFASFYEDGRNSMYIVAKSKKTGFTLIVFNPNERIDKAIIEFLPKHLKHEVLKTRTY